MTGQLLTPPSPACPPFLQGTDFALDLKVLGAHRQLRGGGDRRLERGLARAFGTVSHNVRTVTTTVFASPQATSGPLPHGVFGIGASFRDGLYLTVGTDGCAQDVGIRAAPSASVSVGNLAAYRGDTMDFTFVGASPFAS